ncbi:hypothetical protein TrRE_jg9062 [Triparma retinervis]|uniref:Uncharacterized protein n=1 Tax=Triparma retinervis TaxID=2557542 RepID=A0A9W7DSH2_9STRA|nr:hypothetical protein TrRE_jg9062 [Triparma retinervis]
MEPSFFSPTQLLLQDAHEMRRQMRAQEARWWNLASQTARHRARSRDLQRARQQNALEQALTPATNESHSTSILYRSDGNGNEWESKVEKKSDSHGNVKTYVTDTVTDNATGKKKTRKRQKHVLKGDSDAEVLQRFKGGDEETWTEAWEKGGLGDRMEGGTNLLTAIEAEKMEGGEVEKKEEQSTPLKRTKKTKTKTKTKKKVLLEDASDDESEESSASTSTSTSSLSTSRSSALPNDWMVPVTENE